MQKVTVYGHAHCPYTQKMRKMLTDNNIEFTYIDIAEGIPQMKEFLRLRDTRPEFEPWKKMGKVGVPCVVLGEEEKLLFWGLTLDELK